MSIRIKELRESKDFLNLILQNITSGVMLIDKDVKIYDFNDPTKTLFTQPEDLIIGELCGNALGCSYTEGGKKFCGDTNFCGSCRLRRSIKETFMTKIPQVKQILEREFYVDGKIVNKIYQFSTRYITYKDEELVAIIINDITEEEIARRELKRLNELKNRFLGMAAHDIKNPISVIRTICELAKGKGMTLNIADMDAIQEIEDSANFVLNIINNLLDITSIESGSLSLERGIINYGQLVLKNVRLNQLVAKKKGINIVVENNAGNVYPYIDRNKIEQVLNNLIYNAIKFSNSGTSIKVRISKTPDFIKTEIEDHGKGIRKEEFDMLFQPFKKTSTSSTKNEKGTGLGLAIVKKIIDIHGGRVELESEVGEGSIFSFYLPLNSDID